jgi:phenylacetate-CoA ligase
MNQPNRPTPVPDEYGWAWPYQVPTAQANRIVDAAMIRHIELAPRSFSLQWQTRALQRLLGFVAQASPWWSDWLTPLTALPLASITAEHLQGLPALDRTQFRAAIEINGPLATPPSHGEHSARSTSGSTGVPVQFHITALSSRLAAAHYWADHARHGRNLQLKLASLLTRFAPHPGRPHHVEAGNPWLGIGEVLARRNVDYTMHEHAAWLTQVSPAYLNVAPSVWSGMLDVFEDGVPAPSGLQQVMTLSETVDPELRQRTRDITGASIRDRYSCEELGPVALQCPHIEEAYHVCTSSVILEVVDDTGRPCPPGQPGRVLATGLNYWACPAIRYDLGDIATLQPQCRCGVQQPTLTHLLGRRRFLLRLPTGEHRFFSPKAKDWLQAAPVREHRLTQVSHDEIQVELVLDRPISADEHDAVLTMLRRLIHPDFRYEVQQVPAIAWAPGAKRQDVICLV